MEKLPWSTASVVMVALAAITILALTGLDTSDLMLIVVSLIGGVGAEQLRGLRQQTNGNISRLMDELAENRRTMERILDKVASMPPPPEV